MEIRETSLPGVLRLTPRRFGDGRGWFSESWNARAMAEAGLVFDWVQDNHSHSAEAGTVRGLHYQAPSSMSPSTCAGARRAMAPGWPRSFRPRTARSSWCPGASCTGS